MHQTLLKTTALVGLLCASALPLHAATTVTSDPAPKTNQFWWPESIDLSPLRDQGMESNPYGEDFDYAEAFKKLDLAAVKKDINEVLTSSQPWWPSDYGNYGPFFIRMAWHSAGTYRVFDGRGGAGGGQQRFEPLNSWPDNANLDKARRLLWPVKQKYGRNISWADLMVLTGNVALENMGFDTYGFAGGRTDDWEPDLVYWGPEDKWLASNRTDKDGKIKRPLGATQMGLIYVNPEGPMGNHDPKAAGPAIRNAFGNMAMNDEETVALIAGGHTFGKAHGAHDPKECVGAEPAAGALEDQGMGWKNKCGKGNAEDTTTSGLEGAWTSTPTQWSSQYVDNLLNFEWVKKKSPAGATQWVPKNEAEMQTVPDAHIEGKKHAPIMFTTDIALKEDPAYRKVLEKFQEDPDAYQKAFAKAWFKLTHRDMGPAWRYLGNEVPKDQLMWQDPLPDRDYDLISDAQVASLKQKIMNSGLTIPQLVRTAWSSAASFRASDMRGGANGARVRLEPMKDWEANNPKELAMVLDKLAGIQKNFNGSGKVKVSMADLIVLGGAAAIEKAAKEAGYQNASVPFSPGRVDATQEMTDAESFTYLKPGADGFRNYYDASMEISPARLMVDRADQLNLTVPEMTVLVGGMRVLNTNYDGSSHGVFTDKPGTLSPDYFTNLLDMSTEWKIADADKGLYKGVAREDGQERWTATPVDLMFGSSAELRAVAEVYASQDGREKFLKDFIDAWTKVMNADRPSIEGRNA